MNVIQMVRKESPESETSSDLSAEAAGMAEYIHEMSEALATLAHRHNMTMLA